MNDLERRLKDALEADASKAPRVQRAPDRLRPKVRRRQLGTALVGSLTALTLVALSVAGILAVNRSAPNEPIPAEDPWTGYQVFERTATIETITVTSPSDWYLIDQWPLAVQAEAGSDSATTSCTGVAAPGQEAPEEVLCEGNPSPDPGPASRPRAMPLLLLSRNDPGLGTSPCLDGGIELPGDHAMLEVAVDTRAIQQAEAGAGQELPAWPVAIGEEPVTNGPCGSGHYAHFQVGTYPYIAWVGFGPDVSDAVRQGLLNLAGTMRVERGSIRGTLEEGPGYVIAGGENASGPWRLVLRPSISENPEANVDLHLIGTEGGGPGVADFTVPGATSIEQAGGDPTFGAVTKEATGVELRLEAGTPPIPGTLVPLPPSLRYDFDLFFASNPSDVPATAVPLGISQPSSAEPPPIGTGVDFLERLTQGLIVRSFQPAS